MRALHRTLLITAGVVLALAVVFVALVMAPTPKPEAGIRFTNLEPVDISAVEVENHTGRYSYYYEGDGYVLDDIPATIADLDAFISFMTNAGQLSAQRQVEGASLATYGLQEPAARVYLSFFSGEGMELRIGNQEAISGSYYVTVDGFPGVYLMEEAMATPFLQPKTQMIAKTVTPALAVSSPLSAIRDITFTGGHLNAPITILATANAQGQQRLDALSFGTATHLVRGAGLYQLDQTYGVELLSSLFAIPALDVVGYNITGEGYNAFGLNNPWMTVEYDMVNNTEGTVQHCLLLVAQADENTYYATLQGSGAVYRIAPQAFMGIAFAKLPLRWLLTPMLMDVSALTVEGGGKAYHFAIDNTNPRSPVITSGDTQLDTELFRALFRLATSAAHDGAYLGPLPPPTGEPLITLTYEYKEAEKAPDVLALYPGDVRRAHVYVNGIGEYAMKDTFATRLMEGCESLLAEEPIEENW